MNSGAAGLILMVLTSHGQIKDHKPTGVWLEEFAVPYAVFIEAGYEVTVASPEGGKVPVDPRSLEGDSKPANADKALNLLEASVPLSEVALERYDAVFFPGGHGTMFDLPKSPAVRNTVRHFVGGNLPAAFICHGPAALVGVKGSDGRPIVAGRAVTGFTNEEENAVDLTEAMPFLLETRLKELGADFRQAGMFKEHVVTDGRLVTGQNPASSAAAAHKLLALLEQANAHDTRDEASTPTGILEKEHRLIEKVAARTRHIADEIRQSGRIDREQVGQIHTFFVNFADACHHAKEENELFPLLRERNVSVPILDLLITQHEEGRILLAGVKQEVEQDSPDTAALARYLDEYGMLMQRHIDTENGFLWPRARTELSTEGKEKLSRAFHRIETEELGKGFHETYHQLALDILNKKTPPSPQTKH